MREKVIGIIGAGPRGLSALESLVKAFVDRKITSGFRIVMFDDTPHWGAGPNHAPDILDSNRINLSEREITIERRKPIKIQGGQIDGFPAYDVWAGLKQEPTDIDTYPPRAKLGRYLHDRLISIARPLQEAGVLSCYSERVTGISFSGVDVVLQSEETILKCNEAVLCPGHLPVEADEQLAGWIDWEKPQGVQLQKDSYPIRSYIERVLQNHNQIGIRGFGLTFLDIITAAGNEIGKFRIHQENNRLHVTFKCETNTPPVFYPFSTDGLPPIPKPLSEEVYNSFRLEKQSFEKFKKTLCEGMKADPEKFYEIFIYEMALLASGVFIRLTPDVAKREVEDILVNFLHEESYDFTLFADHSQPVAGLIGDYCAMACGDIPASLDYVLGQVWRHCRTLLYELFWHPPLPDDVLHDVIKLDERMKRYSYGPPVISLLELMALNRTGVVSFKMIDNPNIETSAKGWSLDLNGDQVTVSCMIDSVLSPPDISNTSTPLIRDFLNKLYVRPFFSMGAITNEEALLPDCPSRVALLGRLAKGRVFGTDSIRECFSREVDVWAEGVVKRSFSS